MKAEQREELRRLADQCICHPLSRGVREVEQAGEAIKALLDALEAAEKALESNKAQWLSWEAKRAALEKDAERYRWLRRSNSNDDLPYVARDCWNSWGKLVTRELRNSSADKSIDKAMEAK